MKTIINTASIGMAIGIGMSKKKNAVHQGKGLKSMLPTKRASCETKVFTVKNGWMIACTHSKKA